MSKYGINVAGVYSFLLGKCSDCTIDEPVIPDEPVIVRPEEIAKSIHISINTVKITLKKMEDLGLIQQIHTTGKESAFKIYPFDDPDFDDDSE